MGKWIVCIEDGGIQSRQIIDGKSKADVRKKIKKQLPHLFDYPNCYKSEYGIWIFPYSESTNNLNPFPGAQKKLFDSIKEKKGIKE